MALSGKRVAIPTTKPVTAPAARYETTPPTPHAYSTGTARLAAGRSAVGLALTASASSAPATRGRRASTARTPPTVNESATRSGFTAAPHTTTGKVASHPSARALAVAH